MMFLVLITRQAVTDGDFSLLTAIIPLILTIFYYFFYLVFSVQSPWLFTIHGCHCNNIPLTSNFLFLFSLYPIFICMIDCFFYRCLGLHNYNPYRASALPHLLPFPPTHFPSSPLTYLLHNALHIQPHNMKEPCKCFVAANNTS